MYDMYKPKYFVVVIWNTLVDTVFWIPVYTGMTKKQVIPAEAGIQSF